MEPEWKKTLRRIDIDREPIEKFVGVSVKIPESMVAEMDASGLRRSDFVRKACAAYLDRAAREDGGAGGADAGGAAGEMRGTCRRIGI